MDIRVSRRARADLRDIVAWTYEHFGEEQAEIYRKRILTAIDALAENPDTLITWSTQDLHHSARLAPVARIGKPASHLILFRYVNAAVIEVGRILHEQRDIPRHLPRQYRS